MVQVLNKKVTRKFRAKNLKVKVKDNTGYAELVWLKGVDWVEDKIVVGKKYLIFGKPKIYKKNKKIFQKKLFTLINLQPEFSAAFRSLSESPIIKDSLRFIFLKKLCSKINPGFGFLQKQSFFKILIS